MSEAVKTWDDFVDELIDDAFKCPHCKREDGKCIEHVSVRDIIKQVRVEARRERDKEIANIMIDIVGKFKQEPVKNGAQKVNIKLMYRMGYNVREWLLLLGKFKDVEIEEEEELKK